MEVGDAVKGADVPAVGAGHPERTPGVFQDLRKSKVSWPGWLGGRMVGWPLPSSALALWGVAVVERGWSDCLPGSFIVLAAVLAAVLPPLSTQICCSTPPVPSRHPAPQVFGALTASANTNIHDAIVEDHTVNDVHHNAEQFDRKTELSFKYLQVGAQQPGRLAAVALCEVRLVEIWLAVVGMEAFGSQQVQKSSSANACTSQPL